MILSSELKTHSKTQEPKIRCLLSKFKTKTEDILGKYRKPLAFSLLVAVALVSISCSKSATEKNSYDFQDKQDSNVSDIVSFEADSGKGKEAVTKDSGVKDWNIADVLKPEISPEDAEVEVRDLGVGDGQEPDLSKDTDQDNSEVKDVTYMDTPLDSSYEIEISDDTIPKTYVNCNPDWSIQYGEDWQVIDFDGEVDFYPPNGIEFVIWWEQEMSKAEVRQVEEDILSQIGSFTTTYDDFTTVDGVNADLVKYEGKLYSNGENILVVARYFESNGYGYTLLYDFVNGANNQKNYQFGEDTIATFFLGGCCSTEGELQEIKDLLSSFNTSRNDEPNYDFMGYKEELYCRVGILISKVDYDTGQLIDAYPCKDEASCEYITMLFGMKILNSTVPYEELYPEYVSFSYASDGLMELVPDCYSKLDLVNEDNVYASLSYVKEKIPIMKKYAQDIEASRFRFDYTCPNCWGICPPLDLTHETDLLEMGIKLDTLLTKLENCE